MNKATLKNMRVILIVVYVVFALGLLAWCAQAHHAAKQAIAGLDIQKAKLARLTTEIDNTRRSIDTLKAEQEDFGKLLFNDRDVPSFIDGVSHSAASAKVYIMDMKTQRFTQIVVPKEMSGASHAEQRQAYGDFEDERPKDANKEFKNSVTLAAMPIHIKLHGTFKSIVHFLDSLENTRQLLTISNVEITRDNDYPQLNCDFVLKIYSLQQLKDIKA